MGRADHHALMVNEIVLALIGGVIWRSTDDVQVKQYAGNPANILWMTIEDRRYCFAYKHESSEIEIRDGGIKGVVLHTFNNTTSIADVKDIFQNL